MIPVTNTAITAAAMVSVLNTTNAQQERKGRIERDQLLLKLSISKEEVVKTIVENSDFVFLNGNWKEKKPTQNISWLERLERMLYLGRIDYWDCDNIFKVSERAGKTFLLIKIFEDGYRNIDEDVLLAILTALKQKEVTK